MVEFNADNIVAVSDRQLPGPRKVELVQPVQPVKAIQQNQEDNREVTQRDELSSEAASQPEKLDDAARALNEHVQNIQRQLEFSVDKDSGRVVITVRDKESQEVIRQIPREEALKLAHMLDDGFEPELINTYI